MDILDLQLEKQIKKIAKNKDISIRQLCLKIEMTENGLSRALKNNTLKIETLQRIAIVLKVDIEVFFGGEKKKCKRCEILDKDSKRLADCLEDANNLVRILANNINEKDNVISILQNATNQGNIEAGLYNVLDDMIKDEDSIEKYEKHKLNLTKLHSMNLISEKFYKEEIESIEENISALTVKKLGLKHPHYD